MITKSYLKNTIFISHLLASALGNNTFISRVRKSYQTLFWDGLFRRYAERNIMTSACLYTALFMDHVDILEKGVVLYGSTERKTSA